MLRAAISCALALTVSAAARADMILNDFTVFGGVYVELAGVTMKAGLVGSNGVVKSSLPASQVVQFANVPMPASTPITPGTLDITSGGTPLTPIAPGHYRNMILSSPSVTDVYLTAGDYYFNSVYLTGDFFKNLIIHMDNATASKGTRIFVDKNFDIIDQVDFQFDGKFAKDANPNLALLNRIEVNGNIWVSNSFFKGFVGDLVALDGDILLETSVSSPTIRGTIVAGGQVNVGTFYNITAVPEPSSMAFGFAAMGGLWISRIRRARMSSHRQTIEL